MKLIVIIVVKIVIKISRLFGHNGSALPGLIAEKLYPSLLEKMLTKLSSGIIVVTGTNGKTTTTKIITELLNTNDSRVLTNKSGSNFTRGILSTVIERCTLSGKLPYDIGVFELDEAYARLFTRQVKPKVFVALNVLRDQLDRYGEISKTASLIAESAKSADVVILNADDPPIADLGKVISPNKVRYFGVNPKLKKHLPSDENLHGPSSAKQNAKTDFKIDLELVSTEDLGLSQEVVIKSDMEKFSARLNLKGVYNAVNAVSAMLAVKIIRPELTYQNIADGLKSIHPAFGRGEIIEIEGRQITLGLIKNPAGFNQNIKSFINSDIDALLIAINDRYADGRDVSWLWDVDVTSIKQIPKVYTSGIRAYDMALRLKYSDIPLDINYIDQNIDRSLVKVIQTVKPGGKIVVLPTYTAMLQIRKNFAKHVEMDSIW